MHAKNFELDYGDFVSIEKFRYESADNVVSLVVHLLILLIVDLVRVVVGRGVGDGFVREHFFVVHSADQDVIAGCQIVTFTEKIGVLF